MIRFSCGMQAVSLLVMIGAGAPSYAQGHPPSPLVLQGLGHATLPLDGAWHFRPGDNSAWASPTLDDSTWETIQVGRAWEGQGILTTPASPGTGDI